MITTINEFRKIFEGGGSGIEFTTKLIVTANYHIRLNDIDEFELIEKKYDIKNYPFDAKGYDDGGSNFRSDLIEWKVDDENILEKLSSLKTDSDYSSLFSELKNEFNDNETDFVIELTYYYNFKTMLFRGYVRGNIDLNDVIFSTDDSEITDIDFGVYRGNINDHHIYLPIDGNVDSYYDVELFDVTGSANGEFTYFYQDIFNSDEENVNDIIQDYQETNESKINEKISVEDKVKTDMDKLRPRIEKLIEQANKYKLKLSKFENIVIRYPQIDNSNKTIFIYNNFDRIFRHPDEYGKRGEQATENVNFYKYEEIIGKIITLIETKTKKHGYSINVSA